MPHPSIFSAMNYATHIVSALQKEIEGLPDSFYDSFNYTTTGQNFTHPVTLGLLVKILWQLADVTFVGIDLRLNENKTKFQPDLAAFSSIDPFKPIVFIDYESPNSCDTRIPTKDIDSYIDWSEVTGARVPYIIITTLPTMPTNGWELRWASKGKDNAKYKHRKGELFSNPFRFWYSEYKNLLRTHDLNGVYFININGKKVEPVEL